MKITIQCYARFRDAFGEEREIELTDNSTIGDAVRALAGTSPDAGLLVDDAGNIRSYIMVMHQGSRIPPMDADSTRLSDGETIVLFPPVSGG